MNGMAGRPQLVNGNLLCMGVAEANPTVLNIALPTHLVSALTLVPLGILPEQWIARDKGELLG